MNIMPVNTFINKNETSFKSYSTEVYNKFTDTTYKTTTCFFRDDLNWKSFRNFLINKYKNADKVNTLIYAGSAGEEAYSLAILYKELGEYGKKFEKIISKDFDKAATRKAKSGLFNVTANEFEKIKNFTNKAPEKYFDISKEHSDYKISDNYILTPKDDFKEMVSFSCADIVHDIHNIPEENTVLLCRNFWLYLDTEDVYRLAAGLRDKLKPSSIVVLGAFDVAKGFDKILQMYGFKSTAKPLIYEKRDIGQSSIFNKYSIHRIKSDIS